MIGALWGRITGADKRQKYTSQQASFLGRIGDYVVIYPYGLYCDLPDDVLLKRLGNKAAVSCTVDRPDDTDTGEVVLFHPVTKTRIIMRNSTDIDVITAGKVNVDAGESVNITTPAVNINADVVISGSLSVAGDTALSATVTSGGTDISNSHTHPQQPDSADNNQENTGPPL